MAQRLHVALWYTPRPQSCGMGNLFKAQVYTATCSLWGVMGCLFQGSFPARLLLLVGVGRPDASEPFWYGHALLYQNHLHLGESGISTDMT